MYDGNNMLIVTTSFKES